MCIISEHLFYAVDLWILTCIFLWRLVHLTWVHPRQSRRQCGAGGAGRLCRAHNEAAGWAGRTHDNQHECALYVGWTTSGRVEEFAQGGRLKEGKTQDGRDRCMTRLSGKNRTLIGQSERKCRNLAEPPEAKRRWQFFFGRVLAHQRASSREFPTIFYIILCPLKWCFYRTHVWHIYMYIIATWWEVKMTSASSKKNPHFILYVLIHINMKSWLQHP